MSTIEYTIVGPSLEQLQNLTPGPFTVDAFVTKGTIRISIQVATASIPMLDDAMRSLGWVQNI